jgi:hypothetical protein
VRKSKTYFEQIPVEVAKKIAEEAVPKNKGTGNGKVIVENPATKAAAHGVEHLGLQEKD